MSGLYEGERRKDMDRTRHIEFCPASMVKDGKGYELLMEDISTNGARFRFMDSALVKIHESEKLTFRIKTPYGESVCEGVVEWADGENLTEGLGFGILFSRLSDDPADPLRALIDSGLA